MYYNLSWEGPGGLKISTLIVREEKRLIVEIILS